MADKYTLATDKLTNNVRTFSTISISKQNSVIAGYITLAK